MAKRNHPNHNEQLTKQVLKAYPELKSSNKARSLVRMVSQQVSIKSGPYPSPEDYEHYHEIDPSLTNLMKKMVREEQQYQHNLEYKHMNKNFVLRKRGQIFAFGIFFLSIALGAFAIYSGMEWGGAIIAGLSLTGIITQFLKAS